MDRLTLIRSVDCRESRDHHPATMQSGNIAVAVANVRRRRPSPVDGLARRAVSRAEPAGCMPAFVGLADAGNYWKRPTFWRRPSPAPPTSRSTAASSPGRLALHPAVNVARAQSTVRRQRCCGNSTACVHARWTPATPMAGAWTSTHVKPAHQWSFPVKRAGKPFRSTRNRTGSGISTAVTPWASQALLSGRGGWSKGGCHLRGRQRLLRALRQPRRQRDLGRSDQGPQAALAAHRPPPVYALVNDSWSGARGLLDSTLILMMGEFGRTPISITATGGRRTLP